jgi:hypothetical protein
MKPAALAILMLLAGCARFSTVQEDIRPEGTRIVTRVTGYTLFRGESSLANFSASQTEKTQGAKVGSWTGKSETDLNQIVQAVATGVAAGLKR